MTAREDLIGFALVALPNESAFAKCEQLADAYRAEVRAEAAAELDQVRARLNAVLDICDREQRNAMRWQDPIPVPEWVAKVQRAALGDGGGR